MTDTLEISRFLNEAMEKQGVESLTTQEAARLLDEAGLLIDDASKPGKPLRELMRSGDFPGAVKEGGRWVIYRSGSETQASEEQAPHGEEAKGSDGESASKEAEQGPDLTEGFAVHEAGEPVHSRLSIALRFVYSLFFLLVFEVVRLVLQVALLYQYVYFFVARRHSENVRIFCNKVSLYAYKILRYATLNENERPFPLHPFPEDLEKPCDEVRLD